MRGLEQHANSTLCLALAVLHWLLTSVLIMRVRHSSTVSGMRLPTRATSVAFSLLSIIFLAKKLTVSTTHLKAGSLQYCSSEAQDYQGQAYTD